MHALRLTDAHDPKAIAARAGLLPDASWYTTLLTPAEGDVFVTKPDGEPLLCVVRRAIAGPLLRQAYEAIVPLARHTPQDNRGLAAGIIGEKVPKRAVHGNVGSGLVSKRTRVRFYALLLDGTASKTSYGLRVPSFVAGFVDRSARFPYCRQTVYTHDSPERFVALLPCLQRVSALMATHLPKRHAAQAAHVACIAPDFVIPGTVFITLTINRNWATALHQDAGDLREGFGAMLCWRFGVYTGGYYCMPQFAIAVDLHQGDLLMSDVHEWHCNTAIDGDPARFERITMVCYVRERMVDCGSYSDELERAKRLRGALVLGEG